jgi:hypothetical protein
MFAIFMGAAYSNKAIHDLSHHYRNTVKIQYLTLIQDYAFGYHLSPINIRNL